MKITQPAKVLVSLSAVPEYTVVRWEDALYFKGSSYYNNQYAIGLAPGAHQLTINAQTKVEIVDTELIVKS